MIDSGANISIARKSLAENMGLEIKQYQKRVVIQFGKEGAKSVAKGYANFGELLGDIAIVEDAHETLIKMDTFTDRGMVVEFQGDKVRIKEQNGDVLYVGKKDNENKLYYVDIEGIMKVKRDRNGEGKSQETSYAVMIETEQKDKKAKSRKSLKGEKIPIPPIEAATSEVWNRLSEHEKKHR